MRREIVLPTWKGDKTPTVEAVMVSDFVGVAWLEKTDTRSPDGSVTTTPAGFGAVHVGGLALGWRRFQDRYTALSFANCIAHIGGFDWEPFSIVDGRLSGDPQKARAQYNLACDTWDGKFE